ncbi:MAG: hypothetical protein QXR60_05260 [Candidatus Nanoarchaeia archaeon]
MGEDFSHYEPKPTLEKKIKYLAKQLIRKKKQNRTFKPIKLKKKKNKGKRIKLDFSQVLPSGIDRRGYKEAEKRYEQQKKVAEARKPRNILRSKNLFFH